MTQSPLRILHVGSEVAPFSKTGGLGDVIAALPRAQAAIGHDVKLITPLYSTVLNRIQRSGDALVSAVLVGEQSYSVKYTSFSPAENYQQYFLDYDHFFDRDGVYLDPQLNRDYSDNDIRFILLCKAAIDLCEKLNWIPDIIHSHDWQGGLLPLFLKVNSDHLFSNTRSAFTIHNMAYQGLFPRSSMKHVPEAEQYFTLGGPVEYHGMLSFLKAAIEFSDVFNTVSPTYAREIQETREYGFGFEEVLKANSGRFRGILNGIDTAVWNPETDPFIEVNYSSRFVVKKVENKKALCEYTKLPFQKTVPLIGMISRITEQKGLEIIIPLIAEIVDLPAQLVILGTGDPYYEHVLKDFARLFHDRMHVSIAYNDEFAHLIEAGADMFLMPSKFEPSGLNQMMSMRYGTLPIVRATGGLADSVIDADEDGQSGCGFSFTEYNSAALMETIRRAVKTFQDSNRWRKLQRNAMSRDFSWEHSAQDYIEMYRTALASPQWPIS